VRGGMRCCQLTGNGVGGGGMGGVVGLPFDGGVTGTPLQPVATHGFDGLSLRCMSSRALCEGVFAFASSSLPLSCARCAHGTPAEQSELVLFHYLPGVSLLPKREIVVFTSSWEKKETFKAHKSLPF
jgi:hypothetical protein